MVHDNYKTYVSSRILANSITASNGCIEYAGGNLKHKYGLVSITIDGKRKSVPAHRAMYMAVNDCFDLPRNAMIRHKCDNPCCVNIEHLVAGTGKDNMQDCIERGRRAKSHAPHTRHRKLTDDDVRAIRLSTDKLKVLAYRYGVSIAQVSRIQRGSRKQLVVQG